MLQLRLAIAFLTLLPIAPSKPASKEDFGRSIKYFSWAGLLYACLNLAIIYAFRALSGILEQDFLANSPLLVAWTIVLGNIFLSGGLHLDGFMDSFDGVAAAKGNRQDTLTVMKDSRVGAFGAMAACILLISQVIFLGQFDFANDFYSIAYYLFLVPILSRLLMVAAIIRNRNITEADSSTKMFTENSRPVLDLIINTIPFALAAIANAFWEFVSFEQLTNIMLCLAVCIVLARLAAAWLTKKLYGHNGDTYGASLVIFETICFLGFLMLG